MEEQEKMVTTKEEGRVKRSIKDYGAPLLSNGIKIGGIVGLGVCGYLIRAKIHAALIAIIL